jgi:hypothetical protein
MSGRIGENIVLPEKLRNQRKLKNRRNKNAFPFNEVNLFMTPI